jgi:hypothetical protein
VNWKAAVGDWLLVSGWWLVAVGCWLVAGGRRKRYLFVFGDALFWDFWVNEAKAGAM